MITAVDSSVILDVVTDDPRFAGASVSVLRSATAQGRLVVCEAVIAEIRPAFVSSAAFDEFLADWRLRFSASTRESGELAGRMFAKYLQRGGAERRVVPDFLIGAHASLHADRLAARDRGCLRDYFASLEVVTPDA